MANAIRLAVIGAGSAQFSLGLVRDLCLTEQLRGSTIAFMDVDAGRLGLVYELARRYAAEVGADLRFEQTTERAAALCDADFVINTALAGGHTHEEDERALMERHGYYRGVLLGEYYRQFDLMLGVARDMERLCPDAWLIQSSNPVFEGCTLMTRETGTKVIGLCHGHFGYREIAHVLGLDLQDVTFEAPGFNHCIWLTHFRYQGRDAYPLIDEWIRTKAAEYWRAWKPRFHETQMSPAAVQMYQLYDLMPIGDASRALWGEVWWYHLDLAAKQRWWGPLGGFDSGEGWALYLDELNRNLAQIHEVATDPRRRVTDVFPPRKSDEQIVPIIDSLTNDRPGYYQVNVPNQGMLPGVADDVVVEVPALIDGRGVRPMAVDPLPESIMLGVMWPRLLIAERAMAAYLTGDRRYLMQLMLSDHRTRTWEQAEHTLDALMAMPGNEAMSRHFIQRVPKSA
jgi:alpha-galactosidase